MRTATNRDNHAGYVLYSLADKYEFSLDTPWSDLSKEQQDLVMYGTKGELLQLKIPPESKDPKERWLRWPSNFQGIAGQIEQHYRWYRQRGVPSSGMEDYLDRVMVEYECADCKGSRLRSTRMLFRINGSSIYDLGQMNFDELAPFLSTIEPTGPHAQAGLQVLEEIRKRLDLLLGIGFGLLELQSNVGIVVWW